MRWGGVKAYIWSGVECEGPEGLQVDVSKGSCMLRAEEGYLGGSLGCPCNPSP